MFFIVIRLLYSFFILFLFLYRDTSELGKYTLNQNPAVDCRIQEN